MGAGILRTPGLIAGYLGDPLLILGVWLLGGMTVGLYLTFTLIFVLATSGTFELLIGS